jgi:hypothetical protein
MVPAVSSAARRKIARLVYMRSATFDDLRLRDQSFASKQSPSALGRCSAPSEAPFFANSRRVGETPVENAPMCHTLSPTNNNNHNNNDNNRRATSGKPRASSRHGLGLEPRAAVSLQSQLKMTKVLKIGTVNRRSARRLAAPSWTVSNAVRLRLNKVMFSRGRWFSLSVDVGVARHAAPRSDVLWMESWMQ